MRTVFAKWRLLKEQQPNDEAYLDIFKELKQFHETNKKETFDFVTNAMSLQMVLTTRLPKVSKADRSSHGDKLYEMREKLNECIKIFHDIKASLEVMLFFKQ